MAKKTDLQIWAEYRAATAVLGLFRLLPRKLSLILGKAIAVAGYYFFGRLRRVGMRNLELAYPDMSPGDREAILKGTFHNLARVLAVVSKFDTLDSEAIRQMTVMEDRVEAFANDGRGRIILGAHLGNWELAAFCYAEYYGPLSFLARPIDNPRLDEKIRAIRTRRGNIQIDKENSAQAIMRVLRKGGSLGVLVDVNSHPKEGVFVPFFGIPACTAAGVAMLSLRTNALILPFYTVWDEAVGKFRLIHGEPIEPVSTGDRAKDIETITARCMAATEKAVRAYPEQWLWIHRRWKTRPPGEPDLYADL